MSYTIQNVYVEDNALMGPFFRKLTPECNIEKCVICAIWNLVVK
jgi:hypothetical protein